MVCFRAIKAPARRNSVKNEACHPPSHLFHVVIDWTNSDRAVLTSYFAKIAPAKSNFNCSQLLFDAYRNDLSKLHECPWHLSIPFVTSQHIVGLWEIISPVDEVQQSNSLPPFLHHAFGLLTIILPKKDYGLFLGFLFKGCLLKDCCFHNSFSFLTVAWRGR
jgi:hypothetical protein